VIDLEYSGLKVLDIYRLAQIADRLDVSIDWLLGRSDAACPVLRWMDANDGEAGLLAAIAQVAEGKCSLP
jgi:hypothetical protein